LHDVLHLTLPAVDVAREVRLCALPDPVAVERRVFALGLGDDRGEVEVPLAGERVGDAVLKNALGSLRLSRTGKI
jgi:hypothetical protein